MSDIYRDLVMRGGIPDLAFSKQFSTSLIGKRLREDLAAEAEQHPLLDELWPIEDTGLQRHNSSGLCRGKLFQFHTHARDISRLALDCIEGKMAAHP